MPGTDHWRRWRHALRCLRHLCWTPVRIVRRERRARSLAATHSIEQLESQIESDLDRLRSFAKTAAYHRSVRQSTKDVLYDRRADEIAADVRARVRAVAILRARAVRRARRGRVTSADRARVSSIHWIVSVLRDRFRNE